MIHFYAPWAPQCTQMNDVLGELAKDNIHIKFFKVVVASNWALELATNLFKILFGFCLLLFSST